MRSFTTAFTALASASLSIASPPNYAPPSGGPHHGPGWNHGGPPAGPPPGSHSTWDLKNFESLVVFGDSYSDDSRLGYFIEHDGDAPPIGWVDPVVSLSGDHTHLPEGWIAGDRVVTDLHGNV